MFSLKCFLVSIIFSTEYVGIVQVIIIFHRVLFANFQYLIILHIHIQ